MSDTRGTFDLQTPEGGPGGAIAIIHARFESKAACEQWITQTLQAPPIETGACSLRSLMGIDEGIVARPTSVDLQLMPHGGQRITKKLLLAIEGTGLRRRAPAHPRESYPEALDDVQACALHAIARSRSTLALAEILHQAELWRTKPHAPNAPADEQRRLAYLLHPPTVVAIGPSNVGKSSLANALAGRSIAIVDPTPGTTRDHVGVELRCEGLALHWFDTPGVREDAGPIEQAAIEQSADVVRNADLVVSCADGTHAWLDTTPHDAIRCATRADLGSSPHEPHVRTSAHIGTGIQELAANIRQRLLPEDLLGRPLKWAFHPDLRDPTADC